MTGDRAGARPPELYPPHDDDPRRIGAYRVVGRLGAGWSSVVHGALDPDGQSVAIKVVRQELSHDTTFRADFPHDVDRLRRVGGVSTTIVLAADPHAERPWVATPYVPGRSLTEHLREVGPLTGTMLLLFAAGLAEALTAMHAVGLAHRDVKPDNAILAANGPRLVDFGLGLTDRPVGRSGWVFPEGYAGASPDAEADIFGWGCVVALAATGQAPFGSGTAKELRHRVLNSDPVLSGVPDELDFSLRWALAKAPEDRPHASTVLRTLLSEVPGSPHGAGPHARLRALLQRDWHGITPPPHNPHHWALAGEERGANEDAAPVEPTPIAEPAVEPPAGASHTVSSVPAEPGSPAQGNAAEDPRPAPSSAAAGPSAMDDTDSAPPESGSPGLDGPSPDVTAAFAHQANQPRTEQEVEGRGVYSAPEAAPTSPPAVPAPLTHGAPANQANGHRPRGKLRIGILSAVLALALVAGGYTLFRFLPLGSGDSVGSGTADADSGAASDDQAPASPEGENDLPESAAAASPGDAESEGSATGADDDSDPPDPSWPPDLSNSAQQDGYAADLRLRSELEPGCLFEEGVHLSREAVGEASAPTDCLDLPLTSGDQLRITGSRTFAGVNPGSVPLEEFTIHTPEGVIHPDTTRSTQSVDGASLTFELVFSGAPSSGLLTYTGSLEGSGPYPAVGICYDTHTGYSEGLDTCM